MGNFLINSIFYSVAYGLNCALETFVSQAYGQKNFSLCGQYLHRSRIVLVLWFTICYVIFMHAEDTLIFLK